MTATPTAPSTPETDGASIRYFEPGWFTRRVFNPLVARSTSWGLSLKGSRILSVPGRSSGQIRRTVVNVLTLDGTDYLVAPRGTTQWVRNVRVSGSGTLRVGRRTTAFDSVEIADEDKLDILRAYLRAWAWEVGKFFDGLSADSPDEDVRRIAADFPVFRVVPRDDAR